MTESIHFSFGHEPPNGGIPPSATFAQAINPPSMTSAQATTSSNTSPPTSTLADSGPPHGGAPPNGGTMGPPPPAYCPPPAPVPSTGGIIGPPPPPYYSSSIGELPIAQLPSTSSVVGNDLSSVFTASTSAVSWYFRYGGLSIMLHAHSGPSGPAYEPPGQYVDGNILRGQGWSYIAPSEHTTIHFVGNGLRPCDFPNGYYPCQFPFSKHKVPCTMTVRELIERLGCPSGAQKGLTEMICLGNDHFAAGDTFTQGGEASKRILGEVGWTGERKEGTEVWLVVKR